MKRRYQLKYFVENHEVEMVDDKLRKLFLKRSAAPTSLSIKDFYIGSQISIHGRTLELVDYLDPLTKQKLEQQRQHTIGIITPDAINNMGKIMDSIFRNGFLLSRMKMIHLTVDDAKDLYKKKQGSAYFDNVISHMSSGPIVVMELIAEDGLSKLSNLISSLRARYGSGDLETAIEGSKDQQELEGIILILFDSPIFIFFFKRMVKFFLFT